MTNVECLKRIAENLGATVTDDDDTICKVLHKIGDSCEAKFVVTVTGDASAATADNTLAEIKAAHDAGKVVECHYSSFVLHPLTIGDSVCSFGCDVMSNSTTGQRTTISINSSGASIVVFNYEVTPAS